jgi:alkyl hydroperoxide reductase subunit AhpC
MAPQFKNINAVSGEVFKTVALDDYKGKYLVMIFYPFDFTYVCPTELIAYSEAVNKFEELNAKILGISTDSHHTHLAWIKTPRTEGGLGKLEYPLLGDFSKDISRNYGVLVEDPNDIMFGAALRGIFIIDASGKVRSV